MKEWVCTVYGYVHEGGNALERCPQCDVPASKFKEQTPEGMAWVCEHEVGVAQDSPEDIVVDLKANFEGECSEIGIYLTTPGVAHREGYSEIGTYWAKAVFEEAEHVTRLAELLGRVVASSTKKNLGMEVTAENGATVSKFGLAKRAKAPNLDAIHDTVHEMAKGEARRGRTFEGLLRRCFG